MHFYVVSSQINNFQTGIHQRPSPGQTTDASPTQTIWFCCQCEGKPSRTDQTGDEHNHSDATCLELGPVGGAGERYHGNQGADNLRADSSDHGDNHDRSKFTVTGSLYGTVIFLTFLGRDFST